MAFSSLFSLNILNLAYDFFFPFMIPQKDSVQSFTLLNFQHYSRPTCITSINNTGFLSVDGKKGPISTQAELILLFSPSLVFLSYFKN